jgi:hypothetical protein
VCKGAVFLCFADTKALQRNIEWIRAVLWLCRILGRHFSVITDMCTGLSGHQALIKLLHHFVVVQFHIQLIAHFNYQGSVLVRAKASIEPKTGFNRLQVLSVLAFELFQAFGHDLFLVQMRAQPEHCFAQLFESNLYRFS